MRFNTLLYVTVVFGAILSMLSSCNGAGTQTKTADSTLGPAIKAPAYSALSQTGTNDTMANDMNEIMYAVVADTGLDYYPLMREMYAISSSLHFPVDTMNRYYNKKKKKIVLHDNDEDEMYRGEYFPRRYTSEFLSLEYYWEYSDLTTDRTIALIAGLYESPKSADSMLAIVKPQAPHCFVRRAKVYMGCMH